MRIGIDDNSNEELQFNSLQSLLRPVTLVQLFYTFPGGWPGGGNSGHVTNEFVTEK